MPRVMPSTSRDAIGSPVIEAKNTSGSWLIRGGWALLSLLLVDRYLQYSEKLEALDMINQVREETLQKRAQLLADSKDKPILFTCVVREQYGMGGSHGLENVKKGDLVEVVEEAVGPDQYYNLCRTRNSDGDVLSVGWYPIGYLEKVKATKKSWWKLW
jgi:hypothetical protein